MTAARNAVLFAPLGYLFHAPSFSFEGDSSIITPKPLSAVFTCKMRCRGYCYFECIIIYIFFPSFSLIARLFLLIFYKSAEIFDRFFAVFQNFMSITVFKVLLTARVITLLFSVLWTLHII